MARKEFAGAAPQTTLTGSMTAGSPTSGGTFSVASGTGYPTGAHPGGFVVIIDKGTANEEKILCSSRSGNTFTVASGGRGWDGTTAAAHAGGVTTGTVNHGLDADTVEDFSDHVYDTTRDDHTQYPLKTILTTAGDILYYDGADWVRLAAGTTAQYLRGGTTPAWTTFPTVPTTAVFEESHTWTIDTPAVESGDTDFIIPFSVAEHANDVVQIARVEHKINSGTSVTWDLTVNGSGATGFTSLSTTSTTTNTDPTNVNVTNRDKIKPDISAVAGTPKKWEVTVVFLHTVTLS